MFISPAYAQTAGGGGDGGMLVQLLPLILIFVVFYFLLIRPQQNKMKAHKAMVAALRRGDRVVTAGGLIGTVTKVLDDYEAQIELADGIRVKVVRQMIQEVRTRGEPAEKSSSKEDKDGGGDKKAGASPANDDGGKSGGILSGLFGGKPK